MAKLPTAVDLGERPRISPETGSASYTATTGAETAVGEAGARLGELVVKHAIEQQDVLNTTQAEEAWNKYKEAEIQLSVGPKGFMNLKGGDAINGNMFENYTKQLSTLRKTLDESLVSPEAKRKFSARADVTNQQFQHGILTHYAQQQPVYQESVFKSNMAVETASVLAAPMSDDAYESSVARMQGSAVKLLTSRGNTEPGAIQKAKDEIRADLLIARLDTLRFSNPLYAEQLFRAKEKDITNPEQKLKIRDQIEHAALGTRTLIDSRAAFAEAKQKLMMPQAREDVAADGNQSPTPPTVRGDARMLAAAIYGQESSSGAADTSRVNSQGVTGPMQIKDTTWQQYQASGVIPKDLKWNVPADNKRGGELLVEYYYNKYGGDPAKVAAAYYGGEGAVNANGTINRNWRNPQRPIDPTVGQYIDQVVARTQAVSGDATTVAVPLPKRNDVRTIYAQVDDMATKAGEKLWPGEPNNPARLKYEQAFGVQMRAQIGHDAQALEGVQKQASDTLIDLVAGRKTGAKMTTEQQLWSTPEGQRAWDMADATTKSAIQSMMERNRRDVEGKPIEVNRQLRQQLFNGIVGGTITRPDQITAYVPLGLNDESHNALQGDLQAFKEGGPGMKTAIAARNAVELEAYRLMSGSQAGNILKMSMQGDAIYVGLDKFKAVLRDKIQAQIKDGKDPYDLLNPASQDYVLGNGPNKLDPASFLPRAGETLSTAADKKRAAETAQIPQAPALRTDAERATWLSALPANVTQFRDETGKIWNVPPRASGKTQPSSAGLLEQGNIDLNARPVVKNADGTISTVRSMSFNENGKEVLIPTVAADGSRILSDKEAIQQYHQSGKHLGIFATPEAATAYAKKLHEDQARIYGKAAQPNAVDAATEEFRNKFRVQKGSP